MDKQLLRKAQKIKLIATDIDGVWTDSKMHYTEKGLSTLYIKWNCKFNNRSFT